MNRKYIIYNRVSTDEQAEKGYSLEAMIEKCRHYIESQEDSTLVKTYVDKGFSGIIPPSKRPALNKLLTDLKTKAVDWDTLLIWKLDRLSRSMRDTLNIEYILRKAGKTLESVTERVDTDTASGKMFFNTVASFAEFESAQIGERTRNAMSSKVGEIRLGGQAPLGYKFLDKKLVVDDVTAKVVKKIFTSYLRHKNLTKVASYLNKQQVCTARGKQWTHEQVKQIISNPVYLGQTVWGRRLRKLKRFNPPEKWIVIPKTHQQIISENTWKKTQEILKR